MKTKNNTVKTIALIIGVIAYALFIGYSFLTNYPAGKAIGQNFFDFAIEMVKVVPFAFILIGLFEAWVKKETVEKHLGQNSGFLSYLWVILLAGTTVGGLYVAFPVCYSLYKKGARLSVIFTYLGSAAIVRIPMTIFEASFLGIKFTAIRLLVSLPLVIFSSILMEKILLKTGFEFHQED